MKRLSGIIAEYCWIALLVLFALPAIIEGQAPPVKITHHFTLPDSAPLSPMLPTVSEYLPSVDHDRWWHEIAACEGLWLPPDYLRVRFFQVNAHHFYDADHPQLFERDGVIYVYWAVATSYMFELNMFVSIEHRDEELVIKHEMLHFLIFWNGVPPVGRNGHPKPFYDRCGMAVTYHAPPPRS